MSSVATPFIFALPNETLRTIFSLFHPCLRIDFVTDDGISYNTPQILVLRSVSRRFRAICNDLDFWYKDDFDFSSLLPSYVFMTLPPSRILNFLRALFEDEMFASRFSHKAGWEFSSFENVLSVIATVPFFHRNVRRITLKLLEQVNMSTAIRVLVICHHVVTLSLQINPGYIGNPQCIQSFDLSSIEHSFPLLENLKLSGLVKYEGYLKNAKLQNLSVYIPSVVGVTPYLKQSLFPFNSAPTLTRLCLVVSSSKSKLGEENPFDDLVNLTTLELVTLSKKLCNLLTTAKIKLHHFTVKIYMSEHKTKSLVAMFSSPSLQQLETLAMNYEPPDTEDSEGYMESSMKIIHSITSNIQSLRIFRVDMGMDISWCCLFVQMTNLQILRWAIQKEYRVERKDFPGQYDDVVIFPHVEGCTGWEDSRIKVVEEFQRIFANFEEKPHTVIEFSKWVDNVKGVSFKCDLFMHLFD